MAQRYSYLLYSEKYNILSYWLPPLLAAAIILAFSGNIASPNHTLTLAKWLLSLMPSWTQLSPEIVNGWLRKGWHVLIYFTLYYFWFRALLGLTGLPKWKAVLYSLGLCLVVACLDEGRQFLVPSRDGKIQDVVMDMSAAAVAAALSVISAFLRSGTKALREFR